MGPLKLRSLEWFHKDVLLLPLTCLFPHPAAPVFAHRRRAVVIDKHRGLQSRSTSRPALPA